MLTDKPAILHQACLIPFAVAFFKVFYQLAGISGTLKAMGQPLALDTIFYLALAAVFRLAYVAVQAAGTRLFIITMLIADQTVHAARGKHKGVNILCRHFHIPLCPFPLLDFLVFLLPVLLIASSFPAEARHRRPYPFELKTK